MSGAASRLIHNERIRLRAALFNAWAGSCFTVGVAAPIAAGLFYGASNIPLRALVAGVIFWIGTRWWTERHEPRGWRCGTCHPPPAETLRWEGNGLSATAWAGRETGAGAPPTGPPSPTHRGAELR